MYIPMYTHMYVCSHLPTNLCTICKSLYTQKHENVYTYIHTYMCVQLPANEPMCYLKSLYTQNHEHVYTYVYTSIYMCSCLPGILCAICKSLYTQKHENVYTYIHTYMCVQLPANEPMCYLQVLIYTKT